MDTGDPKPSANSISNLDIVDLRLPEIRPDGLLPASMTDMTTSHASRNRSSTPDEEDAEAERLKTAVLNRPGG